MMFIDGGVYEKILNNNGVFTHEDDWPYPIYAIESSECSDYKGEKLFVPGKGYTGFKLLKGSRLGITQNQGYGARKYHYEYKVAGKLGGIFGNMIMDGNLFITVKKGKSERSKQMGLGMAQVEKAFISSFLGGVIKSFHDRKASLELRQTLYDRGSISLDISRTRISAIYTGGVSYEAGLSAKSIFRDLIKLEDIQAGC